MFLFIREQKVCPRKSQQVNEPKSFGIVEISEKLGVERRFTLLKVLSISGNIHKSSGHI